MDALNARYETPYTWRGTENVDGLTWLGAAAYALDPAEVDKCLGQGADPDQASSFGGGSSPALLAVAGYCDRMECEGTLRAREDCVHILDALQRKGGSFVIPSSVEIPVKRVAELVLSADKFHLDATSRQLIRLLL